MDVESEPSDGRRREVLLWPLARVSLNVLLVAAGLVLLARGVAELRLVVVPVLLALLVASLLVPVADLLRRALPSVAATLVAMIGAGALLTGLLSLIVPAVVDELGAVGESAQDGLNQAARWLTEGPLDLTQAEIDEKIQSAIDGVRSSGGLSGGLLSGAALAGELATGAVLTLILTFLFVNGGRGIFDWSVEQFPGARQGQAREIGERVWEVISGYIRGVAVVAIFDALLIGLALVLIGVPLVIPLMVLTFLGAFVPLVGAFTAGGVAALVALVTGGVLDAALVVLAITVVQQVEGNVLYPLVVGKSISLHPVAILLALTAGTILAGILGTLLAVPIAAAAWAAVTVLRAPPGDAPAAKSG